MSPAPTRVRTGLRLVALAGLSALVLASCGTVKMVNAPRLSGTPALSISVPLTSVGCTLNDVCVAVGTSSEGAGAASVGEYSTPKGNWFNLALPTSASPLITSTACSGSTCVLGGSQPGRDLLWHFVAIGHTLGVATPPSGGIGIDALTCDGPDCSLIDTGSLGGTLRISSSIDGGLTWTTALDIPWATGDAITSFSCGEPLACAVGTLSSQHQLALHVTRDGGTTWSALVTPSSWTRLSSLLCQKHYCVALAGANGAPQLVRSKNLGRTWTSMSLAKTANALACTTFASCVVVGQDSSENPWLATVHEKVATNVSLRYVPTPLLNVACGSKVCAAIGVTTLLSVPSPL